MLVNISQNWSHIPNYQSPPGRFCEISQHVDNLPTVIFSHRTLSLDILSIFSVTLLFYCIFPSSYTFSYFYRSTFPKYFFSLPGVVYLWNAANHAIWVFRSTAFSDTTFDKQVQDSHEVTIRCVARCADRDALFLCCQLFQVVFKDVLPDGTCQRFTSWKIFSLKIQDIRKSASIQPKPSLSNLV